MKYIKMGTPDYEVWVPDDRWPVVLGTNECDLNEQGQPIKMHSRLCYPDKTYLCPLHPKEAIRKLEEADSTIPGLDDDCSH